MDTLKHLTLDLLTAQLTDLISAAGAGLPETALQARHMYHGHHLGQPLGAGAGTDFAYWRGPMVRPDPAATEAAQRAAQTHVNEFQTALLRSFTSTNFVRECINREVNSSTARMSWTVMQVDQDREKEEGRTALEQEADALLTDWWKTDRRHPERSIRTALQYARREGRGILRFRVAGGLFRPGEGGTLTVRPGLKPAAIARYIRLGALTHPEQCRVWEDPDTFERKAVYAYRDAQDRQCVEVSAYNETQDRTVLRIVREGQDVPAPPVMLRLGGRIHYIEVQLDPLITPQFLENQMAYNTSSTMILRNTELAGWLERYGINIEPPFDLVDDPNRPGQKMRKYATVKPGPGTMMAWQQTTIKSRDQNGNLLSEQALGKPEYGRFEPVSPDALIAATDHHKLNMFSEVGQLYVLMGKDATATGRSREVAMSDADTIRAETVAVTEDVIGDVCETFLALVGALSGTPGRYDRIDVTGTVKSRIVPPSSEDRKADRDDVAAGIISKATARQRQGIDDPAQEDAQIQREQDAAPGTDPPESGDPPDSPPADPPDDPPDPPPDPKPDRKAQRPRTGRKGRRT